MRGLHGAYGGSWYACRARGGKNSACLCTTVTFSVNQYSFYLKHHWKEEELRFTYQERCQRCRDDRYMDDPVFSHILLMPSLNLGQICNTQNRAMALNPEVGNYQSRDSAGSRVFQNCSASTSALWISKIIYHFSLFYFLSSS